MVTGFSNTSTPDPNGEDDCNTGTFLICLPFVWQKGTMSALPLLGGNNGQASGINNRGQIVGGAEASMQDSCSIFFLQVEAVLWENGEVQELPPFPGDLDGFANAINDSGEVTGVTGCVATNTVRAVLWPKGPNGGVIDLGNLGGTGGNVPSDINNQGQVVGQSDLPSDSTHHAFLWTKETGMQDLGTLNGQPMSLAFGINNQSQIVGIFEDFAGDNTTGFLWENGVMTDLNTLIPPESPLFLKEPVDINDRGEIVGFGLLSDGEQRGFLLTPCDEKHPGVEGCDYSMVEASTATSAAPAPHEVSGHMSPPPAPWLHNNRFRVPAFGRGN
jgi:probable HAF family extracellular repeat protein